MIIIASMCLIFVGCAPTHFGGRLVGVTLQSPVPGVAYLISEHRYDDDPAIANDRVRLDENTHNYNKGSIGPGNDIQLRLMSEQWVFMVARNSDGKLSHPIIFNPEQLPDQTVKADFQDGD